MESLWGLFAAANVAFLGLFPQWETIPFHLIWVGLTVVCWFRLWGLRATAIVLAAVSVSTGTMQVWGALRLGEGLDEVAETPLMAAMFVAMVWHAWRRQAVLEKMQRLVESEREFVSDASHELRTPITVARGHAELIRAAYAGQEAAEDAGVILEELNRLASISDRLLILAAAEHPGFVRRTPIDLERLIDDRAKRWSVTAPRRWEMNVAAEGTLLADEERLQSALDALLENAVKFTREGARIAISAHAEGETAVIEIADAGDGIPREHLSRIFDRFSRVNQDRARGNGGMGLGLAIVKAIVEAHGGSVSVASELGKGATFRILLPGFRPSAAPVVGTRPVRAPLPGRAS